MKRWTAAVGIALAWLWTSAAADAGTTVAAQTAGPTPFISFLDLTVTDPGALRSIEFVVEPKPESVVRPISARYSRAYLEARGYFDVQTGRVTLPVFGLYADFSNTVSLKTSFRRGPASRLTVTIPTEPFDDPSGIYLDPVVVQSRSPAQKLSYDYVMLKGVVGGISPIIIDTEGEVRWVGTAGVSSQPAILYENGIYVGNGTKLTRMEFDGTSSDLADYAPLGVVAFHHNFDPGKRGILLEVDTIDAVESVVIEVDGAGQLLQRWDVNEIVRAAMMAGGDDPTGFVRDGEDWFHNNACSYHKSDDTLILSSRENFVVAVDYDTGAIRWILGDPTKSWYQHASLREFALTLEGDTLPPVGQHAVSMKRNKLLLFDNGANSLNQFPQGENRAYSAARMYRINAKKKVAKEIWTHDPVPSIHSPYCSSVYEDRRRNYLFDYALAGPFLTTDIVGLTRAGEVAFHYSYPIVSFCGVAWNAIPVHLERLVFD